MFLPFEAQKAVQAAAVLLRAEPGRRISYIRLLKLLYIADRDSLKKAGRPILGSRYVAVKNGPMHSAVYDLMKGLHAAEGSWSEYIHADRYDVELVADPGVLELLRSEIETLTEVSQRHTNDSEWDLVDLTHTFPEWQKNYVPDASTTIPFEDVLTAFGFNEDDRKTIISEMQERIEYAKALPSKTLLVTS